MQADQPDYADTHNTAKVPPAVFFDTLFVHKLACAKANGATGALSRRAAEQISAAAHVLRGAWRERRDLPSVWQSGCGLEWNRWSNRCVAAQAQTSGSSVVEAQVNLNQSTNDTIPTVLQSSLVRSHHGELLPVYSQLERCLAAKVKAFSDITIMGRTFLRDARPMPATDMLGSWYTLLREHMDWLSAATNALCALPQGGYSLGNQEGVDPAFASAYVICLNTVLGTDLFCLDPAPSNSISGIRSLAGFAGALAAMSSGLEKVACDMQLLCSGPRQGFNELAFAATAHDSTTLAGKSNPKELTTVQMACAYARALCTMVIDLAARGQLQLYTAFPITACALLDSQDAVAGAMLTLATFMGGLSPREGTT